MKAPLCPLLVALATLCACYDPVYDRPSDFDSGSAVAVEDPDYEAHVRPIWARSCGPACHVSDKPDGGLALDGDADALLDAPSTQTSFLPLVEPGDPDRSYLWLKLEGRQSEASGVGGRMPLTGALSDADRQTLLNWIEAGASP